MYSFRRGNGMVSPSDRLNERSHKMAAAATHTLRHIWCTNFIRWSALQTNWCKSNTYNFILL